MVLKLIKFPLIHRNKETNLIHKIRGEIKNISKRFIYFLSTQTISRLFPTRRVGYLKIEKKEKNNILNIFIYLIIQLTIFIFSLFSFFFFTEPYFSPTSEITYKKSNYKTYESIFTIGEKLDKLGRYWIENGKLLGINIKNISFLLFILFIFSIISIFFISNSSLMNSRSKDRELKIKEEKKGTLIIIIIMLIALSGILLVSDIIQLFLLIELYSLISYVLILYKFNSFIKKYSILYFLIGNLSSAFILLGIIIFYYFTTSFSLIEGNNIFSYYLIKSLTSSINPSLRWIEEINFYGNQIGILFIFIGLLFKLGVFPFLFWVIKIYPLLENKIFTYLLILPQIIYLFKLSDILSFSFSSFFTYFLFSFSIGSILFGSIFGLKFSKFKYIFVSSSILNLGLLLLILTFLSFFTSIPILIKTNIFNYLNNNLLISSLGINISKLEEIEWVINNYSTSLKYLYYYIFIYSLLSLNFLFLFFFIQYLSNTSSNNSTFIQPNSSSSVCKTDENKIKVDEYNIKWYYNKWIFFCFLFTIFSFIGFPPFSGFYPKYFLIKLIFSINSTLFFPLGFILIIISSLLSGVYYLFFFISYLNSSFSTIPNPKGWVFKGRDNKENILNSQPNGLEKKNNFIQLNWHKNLLISYLTLFIIFCSYFNPYLISYFDFLSF